MRTKLFALACLAVLLFVAGCPVKQNLPLDLQVSPQRTQTQTEFTIVGKGFTPNKPAKLSLMFEPGKAVNSYELQPLAADGLGNFTAYYTASYLPGSDPQTKNPSFVALDNASGQSKIANVLSAYWYP